MTEVPAAPASPAARAWIPASVGGAAVVGGGVLLVVARQQDVAAARLAHEDAEALRSTATSNRVGGAALIAFGALALAAALTLSVLPPASAAAQAPGPVPAIAPTPGGAVVVLAWSTP